MLDSTTPQFGKPLTAPVGARREAVAAAIALLAELYPKCFSIYERRRRPLKIGIHNDVLAAVDGVITPAELHGALAPTAATQSTSAICARAHAGSTSMASPLGSSPTTKQHMPGKCWPGISAKKKQEQPQPRLKPSPSDYRSPI
jgi:hypothetical protein